MSNIVTVQEYDYLDIDVGKMVGPDGRLSIDDRAHKFFDLRRKGNQLRLATKGFIGLVPLTDNISVLIQPRLPISNLMRLLDFSGVSFSLIPDFVREFQDDPESIDSVQELLIRSFVVGLRVLDRDGLWKEYVRTINRGSSPTGKWVLGATVRSHWARAMFHKVVSEDYRLTSSLEPNRVLKSAIEQAIRFCRSTDSIKLTETIDELRYHANNFRAVVGKANRQSIQAAEELLKGNRLPAHRQQYAALLSIALKILGESGIEIQGVGSNIRAQSFVIDMATVFEKYVLFILRERLPSYIPGVEVLDGNTAGRKSFYVDQQNPPATPDIVIKSDGKTIAVLDCKYKRSPSEHDRYQVVSYALTYDAPKVGFVLPALPSAKESTTKYVGTVGATFPVEVYESRVDVSSAAVLDSERTFAEEVFEKVIQT